MSNEENNIDRLFNERLHEYETPAPADMWGKIDNGLKRKSKIKWLGIVGSMAASIALVISAGIGYYLGVNNNNRVAENKIEINKNSNDAEKSAGQHDVNTLITKPLEINNNSGNFLPNNSLVAENYSEQSNKSNHKIWNSIGELQNSSTSNKVYIEESDIDSDIKLAYITSLKPIVLENVNVPKLAARNQNMNNYLLAIRSETIDIENAKEFQNENEIKKSYTAIRWEVGGNIAPVYAYRNISENNTIYATSVYNNNEKPLYTYAGGLNIQLSAGKWRFESGVYLSNMGQKLENVDINALAYSSIQSNSNQYAPNSDYNKSLYSSNRSMSNINSIGTLALNKNGEKLLSSNAELNEKIGKWGEGRSDILNTPVGADGSENELVSSGEQYYRYIEIPLIAHYKLVEKNISFGISGGVSANMLAENNLFVIIDGKKELMGNTENIERLNYAGIAGLTFEIPVISRVVFRFEPRMRYYFTPISNFEYITAHSFTFGVYSGFSYKF